MQELQSLRSDAEKLEARMAERRKAMQAKPEDGEDPLVKVKGLIIDMIAECNGMPKSECRDCVTVVMDRGSGGAAHDLRGSCRR